MRTYEPLAGESVRLSVVDETGTELRHADVTVDSEGKARAELAGPERVGVFRVIATREADHLPIAEEAFVVEASGDELADPRPRPEFMARIAELTDGRHTASADDAPRLSSYDRH